MKSSSRHLAALLVFLLPTLVAASGGAQPKRTEGDQYWQELFSTYPLNRQVSDLALYNGMLVAVGGFTEAGGRPLNRVGIFDGEMWHSVGGGTNDYTYDVEEYEGGLIVGGTFTQAGGQPIRYLARWTGSDWESMGYVDDTVTCIYKPTQSDDLYIGGVFEVVDGMGCHYIARWDGESWHPLGPGTGWIVHAIQEYQGDLYVGGLFTYAGGECVKYIARWDGYNWYPLSGGLDDLVLSLFVYDGLLIVGGNFMQTNDGLTVNHIASWNGEEWGALGPGLILSRGGHVGALTEHDGQLIAGGQFDYAGALLAKCIACWNGQEWSNLGSGIGGSYVKALLSHESDLYVGGWFQTAGGDTSENMACWSEDMTVVQDVEVDIEGVESYPNPFSSKVTIRLSLPGTTPVKAAVYDIAGRLVKEIGMIARSRGAASLAWDGTDRNGRRVPSGVYTIMISDGRHHATEKVTLMR